MSPTPHIKRFSMPTHEKHGSDGTDVRRHVHPSDWLPPALRAPYTTPHSLSHRRSPKRVFHMALERLCVVALALGTLTGCTNPYALNFAELNYTAAQKSGVIQFSDPKLYPREYLINERRAELSFLETQLSACNEAQIEPEIIRELEVVQAIAAGAGLNFDPASALNFESTTEMAELKNDITRTRLEMQLLQLKRDAQLLQDQPREQQPDPDPPPPPSGNESATTVSSSVSTPSKTEIETLLGKVKELVNDLQADVRGRTTNLEKTASTVGPIDTFNYRTACRATVKNIINQTRLDELHNLEGNTLVRIQTRATVLPENTNYQNTLGVLRMEVVPPELDTSQTLGEVYHTWLGYVNRSINILSGSITQPQIITDPRFLPLSGYFQLQLLEFPKRVLDQNRIQEEAQHCSGLQVTERTPEHCWYVRVALPSVVSSDIDIFDQAVVPLISDLRGAARDIRAAQNGSFSIRPDCDIDRLDNEAPLSQLYDPDSPGKTAREALHRALRIRQIWPTTLTTYVALQNSFKNERLARKLLNDFGEYLERPDLARLSDAANELVDAVASKNEICRETLFAQGPELPPDGFKNALMQTTPRVAVYDVAPSERVQPISTAARAADAVSLAASIAGTLPTYGFGTSGNFAFTRSAVGKADALELAPIVVGFAEPEARQEGDSNRTRAAFGWLLGPKAVLKPRDQKLAFIHPVKPYELHADLSLPGWWPEFTLKAYTAWAPNWRSTDKTGKPTGKTMLTTKETLVREMTVPMQRSSGDMAGLTTLLLKAARATAMLGVPRILGVEPSTVSPCDGTVHFQIWGENVWRASMVHIGGSVVDRQTQGSNGAATAAIRVLPDMRGIVASVDISSLPIRRGRETTLTLWTPDGRDTKQIFFMEQLTNNQCQRPNGTGHVLPFGEPNITALMPERVSACAGELEFTVYGRHLTQGSTVNVGGIAASSVKELPSKKGLSFKVDIKKVPEYYGNSTLITLSGVNGDDWVPLYFSDVRTDGDSCEEPSRHPRIESITPDKISYCQPTASLTLKGRNLGSPLEVRLSGIDGKNVTELEPNDGTLARFEVDLSTARIALKDVESADVEFRTKYGHASATVGIIGSKDNCNNESN